MVLVVLLAVSLGATAGDREDVEMLQIQSRPRRMPVIVDTDMDTDDQMALAFLLGEPSIEVKAITTLADGWSNQWSGVQNAMRLTQAWGQPDIPVAYSTRYNGDTQLNMMQPNDLPNPTLLTGIGNFLSEFVPLPFNVRPPSWMYASRLIRETLRKSEHKVDIIELGPLTNLAQVLQEEPELFRKKVRRLYMSGGLIVKRREEGTSEVWPYSSGPDGTSFTGKPPGTSWNIFSDPIAANSVFSFGVPLVIGSSEYEDENQFSTNDTSFIPSSCPLKTAEFLRRAITMLPVANNESESELRYWDESLAVLAIQMIRHLPGTYLGNFGAFDVDDAFQALGPDRPVEYEAWIDSGRPVEEVQSRIDSLIQNNWIDRRTQTVQLDAFFVNLQTTVYVRMKLRIQVYREGLISSELSLVPMRAQVVNHWSHIFLNLCFVILLTVQILSFLQQSHAEYERGLWQLHFWDIWTWLDMLSIVVALVIVFMGIAFMVGTESFTMMVSKLGAMPEWSVLAAPASRKVQSILENRAFRGQCTELLNAVDGVLGLSMWLRFMTAWYAVCLCLRFYRGFTGQPRTAVILQSVMYMTNLFLHYLVVFLVVCGNFALSGYILFGEQVRDWSTFGGSIITLTQVLLGEFDYAAMKNVAPVLALIWWWSFFLTTTVVLSKVLTAAVLQLFLEVRQALGEPGIGLPRQILAVMKNIWHQRSYEGSMKSVPDDDLLKMLAKDLDPAHVKKLMQMKTDRRLCTREDLARAEKDVHVDVEFLVKRGMDPASAERLIDRTSKWALGISTTTSATNRLMLLVAKQMEYLSREVLRIQRKVRHRVDRAAQSADRVDVKHAKCAALAKRLRRAQQIPAGWTAHRDENGRRFLRHEESGLTSWTLPRALV